MSEKIDAKDLEYLNHLGVEVEKAKLKAANHSEFLAIKYQITKEDKVQADGTIVRGETLKAPEPRQKLGPRSIEEYQN